jgi:hypothetical protein
MTAMIVAERGGCFLMPVFWRWISWEFGTFENDMTSFHNRDDVLTLLIHLGYLAYDKSRKVYIPNEEVKTIWRTHQY